MSVNQLRILADRIAAHNAVIDDELHHDLDFDYREPEGVGAW